MNIANMSNAELDSFTVRRDQHGTGFTFETFDEFVADTIKPKNWILKGLIARGETSAWVAPPGGLKSALMAELSIAVSWGMDDGTWHGYKQCGIWNVVYFALERADLVRRRIRAYVDEWSKENDGNQPEDTPAIAIVPGVIDLMDVNSVNKVIATVRNTEAVMGGLTGLIVFDTFAKTIAAGGGDEDKAKDQGKVFANIQRIKDALNKGKIGPPHFALVGHTGKDVDRGARGSNALYGDVDVLVTISGSEVKTATVVKANDIPEGPIFSFKSRVHEFGTDQDGDPITVNIVSSEQPEITKPAAREPKLTANQKTVFAMLHTAGKAGLSLEDWNSQAKEAGIGIKRKADLTDNRNALLSKGLVREYNGRWTVNHA